MYSFCKGSNKIIFYPDNINNVNFSSISIRNYLNSVSIYSIDKINDHIELILNEDVNIKQEYHLQYESSVMKINFSPLYKTDAFNDKFYYSGKLGLEYSITHSTFRIWSPAAEEIYLLIYNNGDPAVEETPRRLKMTEDNGLFNITIDENLVGLYYDYEVKVYNQTNIVMDPYAKAVGINGLRAAIIDISASDPEGFENDHGIPLKSYTDAIIYETSVRDISMHPDSGTKTPGKFTALTQDDTKTKDDLSTILAHIKELGVTHVQFMPMYDFSYLSTDEKNPEKYNWGYDPQNYNVPEGSFSTNPYDPLCRIRELKLMIQKLHNEGIGVNMDVVYNHILSNTDIIFEKLFPGYFIRYYEDGRRSNGSGCDNDVASSNKMVRKFILDSVMFWAVEYHLDGFRFDLMGLIDTETMNTIKFNLNSLGRNIMVYGEGWNLQTDLPDNLKASKQNAWTTPEVGYFNDDIRDSVKGSVFDLHNNGFVSGNNRNEEGIRRCVVGSVKYKNLGGSFSSPEQSINYVSCHDNSTLWDKFEFSAKDYSIDEKKNLVKLSNAIVLTSQGVPFIHSGAEFCRTKNGDYNSFKSPDNINWLDWNRKLKFLDVFNYYKGLIKLRKMHPAFRMTKAQDVESHIEFINNNPSGVLSFMIKDHANNDPWKDILVIYNTNRVPVHYVIPNGTWYLCVNDVTSGVEPLSIIETGRIYLQPISTTILYNR